MDTDGFPNLPQGPEKNGGDLGSFGGDGELVWPVSLASLLSCNSSWFRSNLLKGFCYLKYQQLGNP